MRRKLLLLALVLAVGIQSVPTPRRVFAAGEVTRPTYQNRSQIPAQYKWRLEDIYADKAAWEADVKKVERLLNDFEKNKGTLAGSASALKKALDEYSSLMKQLDKAYIYGKMGLDVNMENPALQEIAGKADNLYTLAGEKTSWLTPEIIAIPDSTMKAFLKNESLAPYKAFLQNIQRAKPHTLPQALQELLAQVSPLMRTPEDAFSMLSKDIKFPSIQDESGAEVALTRANFISYMQSKNPMVRKAAFQAYYGTLEKYKDTMAKLLLGAIQADNIGAKVKKYNSALEASLSPNLIPTGVYSQLVGTVNKNLPLLHRYMDLKKKMLGLKELHMYDIYTTMVEWDEKYIPYEQAKQMVLQGLKPLGDEYLGVLNKGFEEGWVDVYATGDKAAGAYQWGSYGTHPYVLLNYEGTLDDVTTIAHEMGHAMHSYYTHGKQPYIYSHYPTFTAEVASTMNEVLMFKSMYANAKTRQEKMYLLDQYLENFRTTLFRQTQFAEFEKIIHEKQQAGEVLNAEALKKIYLEINKKYYGPTVISDDAIAMEWARISHFYSDFYVYQYATSFAASTALAKQVLEEGKPAVDRIKEGFLAAGSSGTPIGMLKAAGVDMSTPKPIEDSMEVFRETLDELQKLIAEEEKSK